MAFIVSYTNWKKLSGRYGLHEPFPKNGTITGFP